MADGPLAYSSRINSKALSPFGAMDNLILTRKVHVDSFGSATFDHGGSGGGL